MQLGLPSAGFLLDALEPALILALLGSVDSLLTALVADSLTGGRHKPDRELIGQDVGNMAAGLFGGLPGAGPCCMDHPEGCLIIGFFNAGGSLNAT